ncbi:MAG: DUF885 family protein [Sphingomicrobium sp.]
MRLIALGLALAAPLTVAAAPAIAAQSASSSYAQLPILFADWRAFNQPTMVGNLPDYSAAAMARQAQGLAAMQRRLAAIDASGWNVAQQNDLKLVQAEMNGLDFYHRVLQPWARDPGFYLSVFPDMSDVPAHEGTYAEPVTDLYKYRWPLSVADQARLAAQLETVAPRLVQARANLANSNAQDLWSYGAQGFYDQADALGRLEAGTLVLRDLSGYRKVTLQGTSPRLRQAVALANAASRGFGDWIKAGAASRTGPSGVGKDNYNWWLKNVLLSPYDFNAQVTLLQRELDRSLASLKLEEVRNRALPATVAIDDPAAFGRFGAERNAKLYTLLVATGMVPDRPYFQDALRAQTVDYTPLAERNFFAHVSALDPSPLTTHFIHWIDLARIEREPNPNPIRAGSPLFNIYADRSEGFATAMEEVVLEAGLYDDIPRGRELVMIMLANRAARGLAALKVQANEMNLAQAGQFHASWTPRGYSDAKSPLVGFEQMLYLRQPGYGPSYIIGKVQLDHLLAGAQHRAELAGRPYSNRALFDAIYAAGIVPWSLIDAEVAASGL